MPADDHEENRRRARAEQHTAEKPRTREVSLARLLFLEGDPAGAATALGLSQAVRGTFDHGDTELHSLAEMLAERLGRTDFDIAYQRGADMTTHEATGRLTTSRA